MPRYSVKPVSDTSPNAFRKIQVPEYHWCRLPVLRGIKPQTAQFVIMEGNSIGLCVKRHKEVWTQNYRACSTGLIVQTENGKHVTSNEQGDIPTLNCIADAADVDAVTLRPLACLLNIGSVILERTMETVDQRTASRQAQLSLQRVLSDGTS